MEDITDEQERHSFQSHPVFDLSTCSPASLWQFLKTSNKIKNKNTNSALNKPVISHKKGKKKFKKWSNTWTASSSNLR